MHIAETHSTSSLIREQYMDREDGFHIRADYQSAGRGQTGNGWVSQRGENLLFSMLLHTPIVPVEQAFGINMAVSLAIHHVLCTIHDMRCTVKWPNDIYIGDRKVCGILVENFLEGNSISRSIVGVGINVHQTAWPEALPNPVSLRELTGETYDKATLCEETVAEIMHQINRLRQGEDLREEYRSVLYRREGWWPYVEREVNITPTQISRSTEGAFEARIVDITPQGELQLELRDGSQKRYHFKQIRFIIPT